MPSDAKNLLALPSPSTPPIALPPKPIPLPPNVRFTPGAVPVPKTAASLTLVPATPSSNISTTLRPVGTRVPMLNRLPLDGVTPCAPGTGRLRTSIGTYVGATHPIRNAAGVDSRPAADPNAAAPAADPAHPAVGVPVPVENPDPAMIPAG